MKPFQKLRKRYYCAGHTLSESTPIARVRGDLSTPGGELHSYNLAVSVDFTKL